MAITVVFDVTQTIVVRATASNGVDSPYYDAITFTGGVDFTPATLNQMLTALGKTQADIRQMFMDRFQAWKAAQAAAQAVVMQPAQLQTLADVYGNDQLSAVDQLDQPTKVAYLTALQSRIAAKLASLS